MLALWLCATPAAADGPRQYEIYDLRIVVDTDQIEADGPVPASRLTIKVHLADGRRIIGLEQVIDGTMGHSWVRDLDDDGNPEIIVAVTGFGSGSYGELIFFEYEDGVFANRMLPLLPDFLTTGYMGHDTFSVDDVVIRHRYPVYAETDANCCPTGGTVEIEYTYSADRFYVTGVDRDR